MKMSSASSDTQISDGGDLRALAVTTPPPFNGDIMRNGDVLLGKDSCSRCGAAEGIDKVGKFIRRTDAIQVPPPKSPEFKWPPVFESNGSSYVFDPRSNMFYEPNSDFFFDCNSKLYYSNKKKAYYSLLDTESGAVFQRLSASNSTDQSTSSPTILPVSDQQAHAVVDTRKKGIAIHIRSKSLSRPRERSQSHGRRSLSRLQGEVDAPLDPRQKEQIQNVEKWNHQLSLKSTMKASHEVALNVASILPNQHVSSSMANYANLNSVLGIAKATSSDLSVGRSVSTNPTSTIPLPSSSIITTRTGQPICVLCKRKFASLDQLRRHEEESELHKSNVAKRKAEELNTPMNQPATIPTIQYEDRAKKRRYLHADVPMLQPKRPEEVRPTMSAIVVDPGSALNHQNVGNQLFQKMLEKAGTLDDLSKPVSGGDLCDSIKGHWRRIESMSQPRGVYRELQDEKVKGIGYV